MIDFEWQRTTARGNAPRSTQKIFAHHQHALHIQDQL
jgi:hypothetical protein